VSREGQQSCEGSGAQVLWGVAEETGIVQSGEEIFPNIQPECPLIWLKTITSCAIASYAGEENDPRIPTTSFQTVVDSNKVSPEPHLLWTKQSQFPQLLPIRSVLHTPHSFVVLLWTHSRTSVFLVVRGPKLNTTLDTLPGLSTEEWLPPKSWWLCSFWYKSGCHWPSLRLGSKHWEARPHLSQQYIQIHNILLPDFTFSCFCCQPVLGGLPSEDHVLSKLLPLCWSSEQVWTLVFLSVLCTYCPREKEALSRLWYLN